jgi:hypothetical protein
LIKLTSLHPSTLSKPTVEGKPNRGIATPATLPAAGVRPHSPRAHEMTAAAESLDF